MVAIEHVLVPCLQAAVAVQKVWRGALARRALAQQHRAAGLIQQHWRGHVGQRRYKQLQQAATCLQARVRQWQAARAFLEMRRAAVCIQVRGTRPASLPLGWKKPVSDWHARKDTGVSMLLGVMMVTFVPTGSPQLQHKSCTQLH